MVLLPFSFVKSLDLFYAQCICCSSILFLVQILFSFVLGHVNDMYDNDLYKGK